MESVYDVRIEEAYLASCIIGGKEAYHKAPLLPRHFHRESNKILLRVIREMATNPEVKEIDLPTVFSALTGKNLIDRVGGSVFAGGLTFLAQSAAQDGVTRQYESFRQRGEYKSSRAVV
jgi:hypothetical protein